MTSDKLEAHIKVCPKAIQVQVMQSLPYYKLNINLLETNPITHSDDKFEITRIQ